MLHSRSARGAQATCDTPEQSIFGTKQHVNAIDLMIRGTGFEARHMQFSRWKRDVQHSCSAPAISSLEDMELSRGSERYTYLHCLGCH